MLAFPTREHDCMMADLIAAEDRLIPSVELEAATGASRYQLIRWVKAGLIPPSEKRHGRGHKGGGRSGFWPKSIIGRVAMLRRLSGRGVSVEGLAEIISING